MFLAQPVLSISDHSIYDVLAGGITLLLLSYALLLLVRGLGRSRPGLDIGLPVATAVAIRIFAQALLSLTAVGPTLRGGDEITWIQNAHGLNDTPFASAAWGDTLTGSLHTLVIAVQQGVFDSPEFVLRVTQIGIAVAGLALLAAAVYELAGPRAAWVAAWVMALEPSNIFFSGIIHKESLMILAAGLVALGGARIWKRGELRPLLMMVIGCLIAVATRQYAGFFLIATAAAITFHAGFRHREHGGVRPLGLIAVVVLAGALLAPVFWQASSTESLRTLQASQDANATGAGTSSNLAFEEVDFSTRGAIIVNLPTRVPDVLLRPFPWQIGSASQRFGLIGTIACLIILVMLGRMAWRSRRHIMDRAGPFAYLFLFQLLAYSLSAGNAGTAFRYRTHILAAALGLYVVLRFTLPETESEESGAAEPSVVPAPVSA